MGTGVGEAALAAEVGMMADVGMGAGAGAGFLEGMGGVAALEGAGVAGLGLGTGAGLAGISPLAASAVPGVSAGTLAGTASYNPAVYEQLVNAMANPTTSSQLAAQYGTGADLARVSLGTVTDAGGSVVGDALARSTPYFADVGGTGVSSGLPFPTGGATVTPPLPPLSPATAADVAQAMDVGFNPATATTEMGGNLARQTMNYVNPVDMMQAPTAEVAKNGLGSLNPFTTAYNAFKSLDKPTQYGVAGLGALGAAKYLNRQPGVATPEKYSGPLSKFSYSPDTYTPYTYKPYAAGGPVEEMSNRNAIGANTGYPQSDIQQGAYATPWQTPVSRNVVAGAGDVGVDQMTGMERMAGGGIANLGGYSDGGRLLKGPGDGMSDNIPATIGRKQPARLADGEFVVPADVVSGLGNGSTEAGAKQLYKMLDKVRSARTGTKKQGKQINPNKYTPA